MTSHYSVNVHDNRRMLIIPNIQIGFKQTDQSPKFGSYDIEITFGSKSFNSLDDLDNSIIIGGTSIDDYIRRLNGMILFESSDSGGISKYNVLDGDLLTMVGEKSTPLYLAHVLFNMITKWVKESTLDIELVELTIREN